PVSMNIIGRKYIFLSLSGILVIASFLAIGVWGLRLGIDFTGGSLLAVSFTDMRPASEAISDKMSGLGMGNVGVELAGERDVFLRFRSVGEEKHQEIMRALGELGAVQEKQFTTIGPTIGKELKNRALLALGLALVLIVLYITWAFRQVSLPLASWKYGSVAVVVALFHDIIIPTGALALLGHFVGVEADALFVTALLTILGFSVHDTIVVFDRTRENLRNLKKSEPFEDTVNQSVNETFARSVFTSLTVLLVLAAVLFLGGASTKYFALTLIIGVLLGTYSSIFVASPLLVIWNDFTKKRG
ncbi:MAG: protein translocase subunit SecF, partial [Candidatus Sungiibacteriota bacterium]